LRLQFGFAEDNHFAALKGERTFVPPSWTLRKVIGDKSPNHQ
jgi:hypothetical protein